MVKYLNLWLNVNDNMRNHLAYNARVIYFRKSFGTQFVAYLAPSYYNSMPLNLKINMYLNEFCNAKKNVLEWLFVSIF